MEEHNTIEYIQRDKDDPAWYICVCGNDNEYGGFDPCDIHGNLVEPDEVFNHLCCCECGRFFEIETLRVIGKKSK